MEWVINSAFSLFVVKIFLFFHACALFYILYISRFQKQIIYLLISLLKAERGQLKRGEKLNQGLFKAEVLRVGLRSLTYLRASVTIGPRFYGFSMG